MRKIIYILLLILFSNNLYCWNIYPYDVKKVEVYSGGKLLFSNEQNTNEFYFVRTNWFDEEQVIFNYSSEKYKKKQGISVGTKIICDAITYKSNLLVLSRDGFQYEVILYDDKLKEISSNKVPITATEIDYKAEIIGKLSKYRYLCMINNSLILVSIHKNLLFSEIIDNNVNYSELIKYQNQNYIIDLKKDNQFGILTLYNSSGKFIFTSRLELFDDYKIFQTKDFIILATSRGNLGHTFLQILDKQNGEVKFVKWIKTSINYISSNSLNNLIYFLFRTEFDTSIEIKDISNWKSKNSRNFDLPKNFSRPITFFNTDEKIIIFFQQGIMLFNKDLAISAVHYYNIPVEFSFPINIIYIANKLVLSSKSYSTILTLKSNNYWLLERILSRFWYYLLPSVLLLFVLLFFRLYIRQLSLNERLLNLKSTGILFWVDRLGRLRLANEAGRNFLGISGDWQVKKHLAYYAQEDYTKPILMLIEQALSDREEISEKLTIRTPEAEQEWLCNISPIRNVAGLYQGVVFTAIDITEQLEKKRLSYWAQLAHDMQTNLMTIKLNSENLDELNEINDNRRNKILHQTKVLINRVRDIVTVGRQENIQKSKVNAQEICSEALSEFDEVLFPNIEFWVESESFIVVCDKQRLVRALRNAIENSTKAMIPNKKGLIILGSKRNGKDALFYIKDNGKGMDEETLQKMMNPYFTTAEGKGGFGIGTMIIKRVIEQHGGTFNIISELGKGTEIIINIPNY